MVEKHLFDLSSAKKSKWVGFNYPHIKTPEIHSEPVNIPLKARPAYSKNVCWASVKQAQHTWEGMNMF